jgi:hypothetical protein
VLIGFQRIVPTTQQVTLRLKQLKQARDKAQQLMIKAQQSWVKHRDTPKYKEGDQVWLEGKNLRINQPTAKLAPRRHGPFKVIKVLSPVSYQLATSHTVEHSPCVSHQSSHTIPRDNNTWAQLSAPITGSS